MASSNAKITMKTWAISQIRMLSRKPRQTRGQAAWMSSHEKNWRWTAGHVAERLTHQAKQPEHDGGAGHADQHRRPSLLGGGRPPPLAHRSPDAVVTR